ncbi:TPA: hypothetical protein O4E86_003444 [Klebsiella oxytoca]|uniref:hypothetical protein n=1 Tax=Enterobacteriaceae TaxID=543 RepID=UPI001B9A9D36|nr:MULTISPECIES: hypothetical protein [Enterobacteriaceae]MCW9662092.1 hypothetical protein [Klebsiella oxytoca]MDH0670028.1 hypothetical protein [Enterobacter hormaechei]MDH0714556.1 hypothetical protein [Enterobacter hormaechei]HBC7877518.1 hypothetical protein [Klebsiella oxytoca]HCL7584958.1 hypothetical protein [Klebsiella oxytoca]
MMKDILLFGAGHDGTKRRVEHSKDTCYFNSKAEMSPTGADVVGFKIKHVAYKISTAYPEKGGFLIGVYGEEPSDDQIIKAILKYNPLPVD